MARQGGFTYVGLLFVVALLGVLLASAGEVWQTVARREREEELLFVGAQIAHAIGSYRAATPGEPKRGPRRLEDLLEDRRGIEVGRHLRRIYRDPMTGGAEWGLIKAGDEIVGVHSLSEWTPMKRADLPPELAPGSGGSYQDWRFMGTTAASFPP